MLNLPLSRLSFTAFDFETTGLSSARDMIIEVGAVRVHNGSLTETFHALVDPGIPIPAEASAVHGIHDHDVAGKPKISEIIPSFLDFIQDSVLFAHNASFDMGFFQKALQLSGFPAHSSPVLDTILLSKRVFPGLRSYSLQNLGKWLGLDGGKAHSALDDAILCAQVFQVCIIQSGDERLLTLKDLSCHLPLNS